MKDIAEGYMSFWVFIVPFGVAALAKFIVLAMIALPGGAVGYLPTRQPSSTGSPASSPASGSSSPPKSSASESVLERIRAGRDGSLGPKDNRPSASKWGAAR